MKKEIITLKDPKSPISEIFRTLRTNIQFMNTKRGLKSLLITSTEPSEGKSWVSSNLAVTFAQAGKKVILVDCDMRKGRLFSIFDVAPTPGLSNFLSGVNSNGEDSNTNILSYIRETELDNLYVIPSGNIPPNPSELLVSEQMVEAMNTLEQVCDIVIYDGTPSSLVTDAIIISRYVDTTLIVSAYKQTKLDALEKVKQDILNVGGKIAGVVINKMPVTQKQYYSTYYYGKTPTTSKTTRAVAKPSKQEEQLRIERNRQMIKQKAKDTISQNKTKASVAPIEKLSQTAKTTHKNMEIKGPAKPNQETGIYDFEKENMISKQDPKEKASSAEELLKQMNQYLDEERKKIKKDD